MVDVGIPSPRELNGMKSISMRYRLGQHRNADIELYQDCIFTSAFPIYKQISARRRIVDVVSAT